MGCGRSYQPLYSQTWNPSCTGWILGAPGLLLPAQLDSWPDMWKPCVFQQYCCPWTWWSSGADQADHLLRTEVLGPPWERRFQNAVWPTKWSPGLLILEGPSSSHQEITASHWESPEEYIHWQRTDLELQGLEFSFHFLLILILSGYHKS